MSLIIYFILIATNSNINSPIPGNLGEECAKASRILEQFISTSYPFETSQDLLIFFFFVLLGKEEIENGFDTIIPVSVIKEAKGLAIFTVLKAGFLWSGRAGSGIVVAKLPDGRK
jgi:hypothetical protein